MLQQESIGGILFWIFSTYLTNELPSAVLILTSSEQIKHCKASNYYFFIGMRRNSYYCQEKTMVFQHCSKQSCTIQKPCSVQKLSTSTMQPRGYKPTQIQPQLKIKPLNTINQHRMKQNQPENLSPTITASTTPVSKIMSSQAPLTSQADYIRLPEHVAYYSSAHTHTLTSNNANHHLGKGSSSKRYSYTNEESVIYGSWILNRCTSFLLSTFNSKCRTTNHTLNI